MKIGGRGGQIEFFCDNRGRPGLEFVIIYQRNGELIRKKNLALQESNALRQGNYCIVADCNAFI